MSTCDACREPIIVALIAGKPTAFDPINEPTGDHTITTDNRGTRHAVKLRPNQRAGAKRHGQKLYQPHRRSCTKALTSRRH